jgi:4-hydroxybenzoate polyprenyltransferase
LTVPSSHTSHGIDADAGATNARGQSGIADSRRVSAAPAIVRAMRPHQWVKNLLLLVPLVLSHQASNPAKLWAAGIALASFCLCASGIYIINDLTDLESDRQHPTKRRRPFAAGELTKATGLAMSAALLVSSFSLSLLLPWTFVGLLAVYLVLTVAYSLWLKRKMLVDVILLAVLYTHRIIAGGAATQVLVTMWLLAFAMFFFLSLAFVKRYSELLQVEEVGGEALSGRGYRVSDLRIIESVGPASGYLAVLVFCNYLSSDMVLRLYSRPQVLWCVAPVLLYWITRMWFIARRRMMHDDPIVFAVRDRVSLLAGALVVLILLAGWLPDLHRWPFH